MRRNHRRIILIAAIIIVVLGSGVTVFALHASPKKPAPVATKTTVTAKTTVASSTPPPTSTPTTPASSCNSSTTHNDPTSIDVMVNKKHCLIPIDYAPTDLVSMDGATISAKAAPSFDAMIKAAASAGIDLTVTSSYRSYATQQSVYAGWVAESGQAAADTYSARPGYSEHQTGFAVDLGANGETLSNFNGTPAANWLIANAATYGFIERYPSGYEAITGYEDEEWHYRFVGTTVAEDMQAKGIKTLEQYWNMAGGDYN